jgi:ankyrin repeat protein
MLRELITRSARIKKKLKMVVHPLSWASIFSITSILQLLLPRTSSIDDIPPSRYGYPLHAAAKYGSLQTVQMLVKAGASVNNPNPPDYTPVLSGAARAGSYEKVKFLLDQGANINAIEPGGDSLLAAVTCESKSVLELFLQYGADVNVKVDSFGTALVAVAYNGFLDGIQVLLDAGASFNSAGPFGTALQVAVGYINEDIVRLLLQSRADPNAEVWPTKLFGDIWEDGFQKSYCEIFSILLNGGLKVGIEDWRYIHDRSIEGIRKLEGRLLEVRLHETDRLWLSHQVEEAKTFLDLFEALPQWQAVKDEVLSN